MSPSLVSPSLMSASCLRTQKSRVNARLVLSAAGRTTSLSFAKFICDERKNGLHGFGFIGAFGFYGHRAANSRREHHDAHDAFRVDPAAVAAHPDLALKISCQLCELGRSTRVQPQLVHDSCFLLQHDAPGAK